MTFLGDVLDLQALNGRLARAALDVTELGSRVARALYEENVGPQWERERVVQEIAA